MTLLAQELDQPIVVNENGTKKKVTRMAAIVKRLVADALAGERKAQLTLFEFLRRSGQFEPAEVDSLLPDDYEVILDAYVARRQQAIPPKSPQETKHEQRKERSLPGGDPL